MGTSSDLRSVKRALTTLDALSACGDDGLSVSEIALRLKIDKSSASRLLATLANHGYASRLLSRRYRLGLVPFQIVSARVAPLVQRVTPYLSRVASALGETVYLTQLVGARAVTIARIGATRRAPASIEETSGYPLWATAVGRALLAPLRPIERMQLLPPEPFPVFTDATLTSAAALFARVSREERSGIINDEGEHTEGLACYAVPLGRCPVEVLALGMSFERDRPERDRAYMRRALESAARELRSMAS